MDDVNSDTKPAKRNLRAAPTSTVGRGKAIVLEKGPLLKGAGSRKRDPA